MLIIGCDYHPGMEQIAWFDEESGECGEQPLEHGTGEAERFYRERAETARRASTGGDRSQRAHALVRAAAEGVGDGAVDRQSRPYRGATGAQTKDRPRRCAPSVALVAGRSFSQAVGAESGEPRSAATAVASASPGADADARQEPIARHRPERRRAEEVASVEQSGKNATGIVRAGSVDGAAAARSAPTGGPTDATDRRTQPGGRAGSRATAGGATLDDPSRSGSDHGAGLRVGAGHPRSFSLRQTGGQLSGTDSLRRFQRRETAPGTPEQAGQYVAALPAGRGGASGGALRSAVAAAFPASGHAAATQHRDRRHGP